MRTVLLLILVLLLLGAFPVYAYGGLYGGGSVGVILIVLVVMLLVGER